MLVGNYLKGNKDIYTIFNKEYVKLYSLLRMVSMRNTLIIIDKLEQLDNYLNNIYSNFPKKDIILKEELDIIIKEIYFNIYLIVYNYKIDISIKVISLIKYLNYLIDNIYQKKIINNNRYLYIGSLVIDITQLLRGYINEKNRQPI